MYRVYRDRTLWGLVLSQRRENSNLLFRLSVLSSSRIGKNDLSGLILNPVSPFLDLIDRPVSGIFKEGVMENPAIGSFCLSGGFARGKTGLFRASLNEE